MRTCQVHLMVMVRKGHLFAAVVTTGHYYSSVDIRICRRRPHMFLSIDAKQDKNVQQQHFQTYIHI